MQNVFWTTLVQRLTPYVPGEQRHGDDIVKLNTNENPYPPSDDVLSALKQVDGDALRRYPDPESVELRRSLAQYHGLDVSQVFVGNGSDEILALSFMAFFTNGQALQYPKISYSFYPVYCDLLEIEKQVHPLLADFSINMSAFTDNRGGIIFPNPNAPTSLAEPASAIEALLERVPNTLVLVDEAYVDFGAQSVVELINRYPNLVVSQTFSKSRSLAGMRLGAAFANPSLIEALSRVKNSFNSYPVDAVAQRAGVASISDKAYFQQTMQRVIATRNDTSKALRSRGFQVLDSAANFIFVSPKDGNAASLFDKLNRHGVLVRYWGTDELAAWLRISIGTEADMQKLLDVIDKVESA